MLKHPFLLVLFTISFQLLPAQNKVDNNGVELQKMASLIQENNTENGRYEADSIFTRKLVQTLKTPYSFNFHFDSLISIRHITAPDSSFKLYSWQLDLGEGLYKQRAALQINTADGNLKLLPFFDKSNELDIPEKASISRKKWMGAIYYDIIETSFNSIKYYTLLGFDEYNETMSRKIIEVLHFDENEPILGGDFFVYPKDDTYPLAPIQRFIYTYKKGSNAYIRYEKETGKLTLSELTSISNNLKDKSTLVPTGNEVYFIWNNGKWLMPSKY